MLIKKNHTEKGIDAGFADWEETIKSVRNMSGKNRILLEESDFIQRKNAGIKCVFIS